MIDIRKKLQEDLNPIEEAQAIQMLMTEHKLTQEALSERLGKSRSAVANTLRLLRLPPDVRDMLARGELTAGHARTLITAEDPAGLVTHPRDVIEGTIRVVGIMGLETVLTGVPQHGNDLWHHRLRHVQTPLTMCNRQVQRR